jgi:hypothetical protein
MGGDSDTGSEAGSDSWGETPADADLDEDMNRKEEELQAELNLATKRCQELKETLQNTKSFIEGRGPIRQAMGGTKLNGMVSDEDDDEDDEDEDAYAYDEDNEEVKSISHRLLLSLSQ